ncbi:MAG: NUDIX hydrolase [Flavobacteriaceae bacterium]|nr:NUDIX hydrolase [Flavobacteriaceae bacterium]
MRKQNIAVTVDAVIFYRKSDILNVLLIRRKNDPFRDQWALPGGFLEENETMEEGAKRELEEETGLKIEKLQQVSAFGTPGRDPRGRTISIAFVALIDAEVKVKASDDAVDAKWFSLNDLPDLAFDHREIISEANSLL